jgi:Phosphate-selective porin O and P
MTDWRLWSRLVAGAIALAGFAAMPLRAQVTAMPGIEEPARPAEPPNAAEPPKGASEPTSLVGNGDGISFESASGDFSLQLGFWGQTRFQAYDKDQWRRVDRTALTPPIPVENVGVTQLTFDIPLLRFYMRGKTFKPWLTYKLELNLVANDEGLREILIPAVDPVTGSNSVLVRAGAEAQDGRTVKLVDYYLDGQPLTSIGFRVGQFKVPEGRQELVSDMQLQMTQRSIASAFFAPGRDRGIEAKGATPTGKIGYQVGAFNGTGPTAHANTDSTLAYALRLTAASSGAYLDIESNLDAPDRFHAQGGVSWYTNGQRMTANADPLSLLGNVQDRRVAADLEFFWHKRANLLIEYFQSRIKVDDSIQQRMQQICYGAFLQGLVTCDQQGYNAQAGVTFGDRQEMSGRYSLVDSDRDLDRDRQIETTLNYTYFFRRHVLRWSTSLTFLKLQVNAPGSSGLSVQQGDSSIPPVINFPNPEAFPGLDDDQNKAFVTQLQWVF